MRNTYLHHIIFLLFPFEDISSRTSIANLDDNSVLHQFTKRLLNGCCTDIGACIQDVFLRNLSQFAFDKLMHTFRLGNSLRSQMLYTIRERFIRVLDDSKSVSNKGHIVVLAVAPAGRACLQCVVIGIFCFFNQLFDTDVLSDDVPGTIQQQEG